MWRILVHSVALPDSTLPDYQQTCLVIIGVDTKPGYECKSKSGVFVCLGQFVNDRFTLC